MAAPIFNRKGETIAAMNAKLILLKTL
ncbi:hypothetical protein [Paenisporosarcina sp. OV554]